MIKPISVKLDSELQARLKELGEHQDRSTHWLMKKLFPNSSTGKKPRNKNDNYSWIVGTAIKSKINVVVH